MEGQASEVFISAVSPVYGAPSLLPALCERLDKTLSALTDRYEIILVDDCCPKGSWKVLRELAERYPRLICARLSRNFGQHYAITAGLDLSRGEWVVVMDCDLQDEPESIPLLLEKAMMGYDVVLARRTTRQENLMKRASSGAFHRLFRALSGSQLNGSVGCFRIVNRKVVEAFCSMRERFRMFGGMIEWLGFSTAYVDVARAPRPEGQSSYNLRNGLRLAIDGIVSFSNRPLYISIAAGTLISALAGGYGIYQLFHYFTVGEFGVAGWLSTITLTAFLGGLILLNQGVIGLYVARTYDEAKSRPLYVIDQMVVGEGN